GFRHVAGTSLAGLIDHIDGVALPDEVLRPAFASVGRSEIAGGGAAAAMHEDDRVGLRLFRGDALLDVHLPDHVGLSVEARQLAPDVEKTVAHERHRFLLLRRRRRRKREQGRSHTAERRYQIRLCCSCHHVLPFALFAGRLLRRSHRLHGGYLVAVLLMLVFLPCHDPIAWWRRREISATAWAHASAPRSTSHEP